MSVNRVILVGNLGADPELRHVGDRAVCDLSVATNEAWKDAAGVLQKRTEWHRVTVWGKDAENCAKYLAKGATVYVEGRLQTRSYEKDGVKRYATDVISERVVFIGGTGNRAEDKPAAPARGGWGDPTAAGAGPGQSGEDDIPL
jgi:single-strand DNA-binding protein